MAEPLVGSRDVSGSIAYTVLPGLRRDDVLADPGLVEGAARDDDSDWWRPTAETR